MTRRVREEIIERNQQSHTGILIRVDSTGETKVQDTGHVNCAERFLVCKGVCCRLNYALCVEEIESGKVKWGQVAVAVGFGLPFVEVFTIGFMVPRGR